MQLSALELEPSSPMLPSAGLIALPPQSKSFSFGFGIAAALLHRSTDVLRFFSFFFFFLLFYYLPADMRHNPRIPPRQPELSIACTKCQGNRPEARVKSSPSFRGHGDRQIKESPWAGDISGHGMRDCAATDPDKVNCRPPIKLSVCTRRGHDEGEREMFLCFCFCFYDLSA
jgi:hypothetical protein